MAVILALAPAATLIQNLDGSFRGQQEPIYEMKGLVWRDGRDNVTMATR